MLGRLEVLQDYVEERSRARLDLDQATEAGWRIQELAQTFSSIGQQRWVELDIPELMDEAVGIAKLRHRTRAETRGDFPDTLPKGSGNPVLIREAFSNIFSNALEAIDQGGVVEIGAVQVNGTIVLRVSDNGIGISRAEMERLFEPFHSTKSNGHGLGLFAAKHILEMHHGTVEVQSWEGEGTSVTVRLPAVPARNPDPLESTDSLPLVRLR